MTAIVRLELPLPPPLNNWHIPMIQWVGGRPRAIIVLSKEAKQYKRDVKLIGHGRTPLFGKVVIEDVLVTPSDARMDLDAPFKGLFDSLNGVAWLDDNQVRLLARYRMAEPDREHAGVLITIAGERHCTERETIAHALAVEAREKKRKATLKKNDLGRELASRATSAFVPPPRLRVR